MNSSSYDVIVVGAGLCGLIAARNIARRGSKVVIFEARDRIGGRCWTREFPMGGETKAAGETMTVEAGGEWIDMDVHDGMLEEARAYNLSLERPDYNCAWNFEFPGRKVLTRCVVPGSERAEFDRIIKLINEDLSRFLFKNGYDIIDVEPLDVSFVEYVEKRLGAKSFMHDYLLAEAFVICGADCELHSALSVLHDLAGFGPLEERFNTKPRTGNPFARRDLARLTAGTSQLASCIADEIIALGGEIRFNTSIGSIVCEDVPKAGSDMFCGMCTIFTYPFCSTHGPRVLCVDGLGVPHRARACVLAIPLNCIPCIKFTPPLPEALRHSSEVCNVGNCKKTWVVATDVGWDVDHVLSWPGCPASYVKARFPEGSLGEDTKEESKEESKGEEGGEASPYCRPEDGKEARSTSKPRHLHILAALGLAEALSEDRIEAALRRHHPTLKVRDTLSHDWKADRWARGSWLAVRSGGARLHATACADAKKPWPQTFNLFVAGSDVNVGWSGWMEGAVQSGLEASAAVNLFLFPRLPEGRWMKRILPGEDTRRGAK